MKKLEFITEINAPANIVWSVLWNDKTYRKWTAGFSNDSHAESDWKEGSYIKFLDVKGSGLYSRIIKKIDNAEMHFEHLAELKNFEPNYDSEETK